MRKVSRTRITTSGASSRSGPEVVYVPSHAEGPERLVGLGFRYWMHGRKTGNIACWERAWELYSGAFGLLGGRVAVTQLSTWVGAFGASSCRKIEIADGTRPDFCRDECIAISLIAACQHRTCPALRACAFALLETSQIDGVINEAQDFADTLASLEQVLSPASIMRAPVDFNSPGAVAH